MNRDCTRYYIQGKDERSVQFPRRLNNEHVKTLGDILVNI